MTEAGKKQITKGSKGLLPLKTTSTLSSPVGAPIGSTTRAVGYPLGQTHLKVTQGVLSGQQSNLLQTDAPINNGNSGGPLLWEDKVIGMNCRGFNNANNVGYAVPIHIMLNLIDFLYTGHGYRGFKGSTKPGKPVMSYFPRSWGAAYAPPRNVLSTSLKNGVEITEVYNYPSVLSTTVCVPGDVLLSVNGHPVLSTGELSLRWMHHKMTLTTYLLHLALGKHIEVVFRQHKTGKTVRKRCTILPEDTTRVTFQERFQEMDPIPYLYLLDMSPTLLRKRSDFLSVTSPAYRFRMDIEDQILQPTVDQIKTK